MRSVYFFCLFVFGLCSCKQKKESTFPTKGNITESVYTSGFVRSANQYQAFSNVSGIVSEVYVKEGEKVKMGQPIMALANQTQKLQEQNAALSAQYAGYTQNLNKVKEAELQAEVARKKYQTDSLLLERQKELYRQKVGSEVELEQRDIAFQNSRTAYASAKVRLVDLKRQLLLSSEQSQKNLRISQQLAKEFTIYSMVDGMVFDLLKEKGEWVSPQTPVAILGKADAYVLEMQVDEFDIFKVKEGQTVWVTMDSHPGQTFEAIVSRIIPIMNERNKAFTVEASFKTLPDKIFPNVSFEANILLNTKENTLLVPRRFFVNDSTLLKKDGSTVTVKVGLMDFKMAEVLSGISEKDEVVLP